MKRLIALFLSVAVMLGMIGCGGSTKEAEPTPEPTAAPTAEPTPEPTPEPKVIEYFEELGTLPTPDSLGDAKNAGSSRFTSNGEVTKILYKYTFADGTAVEDYLAELANYGFEVEATGDTEYNLVENKYIVATFSVNEDDDTKAELSIVPEGKREMSSENAVKISLGETINAGKYEFTLLNVELTYELKPANTRGVYVSYPAESGKVYIHVEGNYYNSSKQDVRIRDLPVTKADYDNGYIYSGFTVIDDGDNRFDWVSSYIACAPLETCHYHGLIECPEIVDESDAPLFVTIILGDGITYRYDIR